MKVRRSHTIAVDLTAEEVALACQEFIARKFAAYSVAPLGWNEMTLDHASFALVPGAMDGASATYVYSTPEVGAPGGPTT